LYQSLTSGDYDSPVATILCGSGDESCCQYTYIPPDGTYFWVLTAFDSEGFESEYSDEVTDTVANTPSIPQNLTIEKETEQ